MTWSAVGKCDNAVTASRVKFFNQSRRFVCKLYLSPFCSRVIVCILVSLFIFVSNFLYLVCISLCRVLSIVLWMYGRLLFRVLVRVGVGGIFVSLTVVFYSIRI